MTKFKTGSVSTGLRTDVFLASKYPDFSRSSLKKLFIEEKVLINDKPAKSGQKLDANDIVKVDDKQLFAKPDEVALPILYEDSDVIAINKPAGILTHAKGALNTEPTVASFIKKKLNDGMLMGNRAGIVHRLDRDTSGVIICAKNKSSMVYLQKQFSNRKVQKTYLAVVDGIPVPTEARIEVPIARNPKRPQTFMADMNGRPALTAYKLLKSAHGKSLLELRPETGRTHQIRVHLAYIGHPIIGDRLYGSAGHDKKMLLHAYQLKLDLPSRKNITLLAPAPDDFKIFFNE